jgi:23S rRNA (cytidine1920-2'-O)/16S rRNA (cytidine1409-2'-O)-methyltransferase
MTLRVRLDTLLVRRGLADSREKARALIMAGQVDVNGHGAHKAGTLVDAAADVRVSGPDHPWVSRGGVKLAHAIEVFRVDVAGRVALDVGASTGGFTDVLLHHGARHVFAVDVGHGQLHWKLRQDPRVTVVEGANARHLTPDQIPGLGPGAAIVTIDVSFISLRYILPALPPLLAPSARVIALVKPQFEAGRRDVGRRGIVTDPRVHARVLAEVGAAAAGIGWAVAASIESPITGAEGNKEFLMLLETEPAAGAGPAATGGSEP